MPALSSTMTEGKISQWQKNVGDKVEVGDVLMVVESDKADMDVEAFSEGYLAKILTPEGGTQAVGAPVAILVDSKDDISKASVGCDGGTAVGPPAPAPAAITTAVSVSTGDHTPAPGVINATPKAKQRALENGLDVKTIKGTGNFNRVTEEDVLRAAGKWVEPVKKATAAPTPTPAPVPAVKPAPSPKAGLGIDGVVEMTGMQKAVAKN